MHLLADSFILNKHLFTKKLYYCNIYFYIEFINNLVNIKLSSLVNKRINIEANIEYKYLLTLFIFVFYSRSDAEKSTNSKQQCNRTIIHP